MTFTNTDCVPDSSKNYHSVPLNMSFSYFSLSLYNNPSHTKSDNCSTVYYHSFIKRNGQIS